MTINVQGISDKVKRTKVFRYLREQKVDIACLQETHCTKQKQKLWRNEWHNLFFCSNGESNARGVAIALSGKFSESQVLNVQSDKDGRMIAIQLLVATQKVKIINLYAPNEDNPLFFAEYLQQCCTPEDDLTYLMGDLNVVLNPQIDKKGGVTSPSKSREIINTFLENEDWIDTWRAFHGTDFQFTWKGGKPLVMTRLDYILAPLGSFTKIMKCQIVPATQSDHCLVIITLNLSPNFRGPGYWKFNVSHLHNPIFVSEMNEAIDNLKSRSKQYNPTNRLAFFKSNVRETAVQLSKQHASARRLEKNQLTHKLSNLHKKLSMINLKSDQAVNWIQKTNDKIDEIRQKLDKLNFHDAQGAMLRAKARWASQGEHNTKYFYNLEKTNATNKVMNAAINDNNEVVTNSEKILEIQAKFYSTLYTKQKDFQSNLEGVPPRKLDEETRHSLEKTITNEEIEQAIKSMKRKKAPGADGLQIDFYIVFWLRIKEMFCDMIHFVIQEGKFHETSRLGLISLIPKKRTRFEICQTLETDRFAGR